MKGGSNFNTQETDIRVNKLATFAYICKKISSVRVIARKTLRDFWTGHKDSEAQLTEWYQVVSSSNWKSPHDVKEVYPNADFIGNNRMVFNICRNKYRLIVVFRYNIQMAFIRFIGTHKQYDNITNIKNI